MALASQGSGFRRGAPVSRQSREQSHGIHRLSPRIGGIPVSRCRLDARRNWPGLRGPRRQSAKQPADSSAPIGDFSAHSTARRFSCALAGDAIGDRQRKSRISGRVPGDIDAVGLTAPAIHQHLPHAGRPWLGDRRGPTWTRWGCGRCHCAPRMPTAVRNRGAHAKRRLHVSPRQSYQQVGRLRRNNGVCSSRPSARRLRY